MAKRKRQTIPDHDASTGDDFLGAGSHIEHSIEELIPKLVATAALIPDVEKGREQLISVFNAAFDAKFGRAMARIDQKIERTTKKIEALSQQLADAQAIDAITPDVLITGYGTDDDDGEGSETPFDLWQVRHRIEIMLLSVFLAIAFGASWYTAWANLVGTGLPIFLDNPLLPAAMASLVPMTSMAIKTVWHSLSDRGRFVFTRVLLGSMFISFLCFALLFADRFHGMSAGATTAGLFDEPGVWDERKDTALVLFTLLTEMLVGASLAHRIDKIAARYSPDCEITNPDKVRSVSRVQFFETAVDAENEKLEELHGAKRAFESSRDLQSGIALIKYDAKRERIEDETL